MLSRFQVIRYIYPEQSKPFRIVENMATVDGVRSRLTNLVFSSEGEAKYKADELNRSDAKSP